MQAVVIRAKDGIPYLPNTTNVKSGEEGAFHIAAHGGPWHLYEAIRASTYNTEDPDEADFVYVYDHCLYMQWLAQVGKAKPFCVVVLRLGTFDCHSIHRISRIRRPPVIFAIYP